MQFSRPVQEQFETDGINFVIFEAEGPYIRGSAYAFKNGQLFNEDIQVSLRFGDQTMTRIHKEFPRMAERIRQAMEHHQPESEHKC